ncbi:hypothetical protein BDP27DRAFT_1317785 [Rhodocollybia butyracea]|uniref:Uncharacterized protein n=1 Tax=Rhodocollybia butyracea TaxID=206335 RepID=A0A9P5PWW2_9AGAR|nr:hypothetical protein BDP27DRAFT_1317785 [Rhodocollybia butyracea]
MFADSLFICVSLPQSLPTSSLFSVQPPTASFKRNLFSLRSAQLFACDGSFYPCVAVVTLPTMTSGFEQFRSTSITIAVTYSV